MNNETKIPETVKEVLEAYLSGAIIEFDDSGYVCEYWLSQDGKSWYYRQFNLKTKTWEPELITSYPEFNCNHIINITFSAKKTKKLTVKDKKS